MRALASAPLLRSLSEVERATLAAKLELERLEAGRVVVVQGAATDRRMYLCVSGHALVSRDGVEIERIGPGDHFGELALAAGVPRAATVRALEPLELATLGHEAYDALQHESPDVGRKLLEAFTRSLAARLTSVTDGMRTLLRARSWPRRAVLEVLVDGERRNVAPGTAVRALLPETVGGHPVVAALVDRTAVSLSTPVGSSCTVEALTTAHWEGQRVYRLSVGLLLLEAAHRLAPGARVQLQDSVGFAQRVEVDASAFPLLTTKLHVEMERLSAERRPLLEELWTVDEARDLFRERGLSDVVRLLETWREPAVPLVSYGEVYVLGLGAFVSDTGLLKEHGIDLDESGLLLLFGDRVVSRSVQRSSVPPPAHELGGHARAVYSQTRDVTVDQDRFRRAVGVTSVGAFNRACVDGNVTQLIRVHEGFHEKAIGRIADTIAATRGEVRIVTVAGPSSSGKTTFIRRLRVQLQVVGIDPVGLSLDDYYADRDLTPLDEQGEYDFEALEAIDLALFSKHLGALLEGETVRTARYDFQTGRSLPAGGPEIGLGPDQVLMIEGLHGLNPQILDGVSSARAFRVFVCPLTQLPFDPLTRTHASDVRLLRRIVRDRHQRNTAADSNILRWPAVRRGELLHIYPFQHHADAVFDSSLAYEAAVLKVYAERYLLEVPRSSPAYTTAFRLLRLLDRFVAIYPDQVPPTSILREFIGGSGFER
ncbi:MAG: cyclic nucleotide-binding domain-containing protein [Deltaproteobacteria bacterium]|nr:cyclic nucleotide-binding domain-containing protein [Deltaproteobacteria bacterium]